MNLLPDLALACAAFAAACWLLSVVTRECSWVDRIWSITPVVYVGWTALAIDPRQPRLVLMAALVAAWGGRLTFNFARKGGYGRGGEDYRWGELRKRMSPTTFAVFNLVFIAAYQNALLLALAVPALVAADHPGPLGAIDLVLAAVFVALLAGETIADEQQWRFHVDKRRRGDAGDRGPPRFLAHGLFRASRHPNFFCEIAMWWTIYGFGVAASGQWWNAGLVGPILLTSLFHGSTKFTESITLAKYPEYAEYQRTTSRIIPWWR